MKKLELLGYFAGFLLLFCDIPQMWKIYRTKSARDISALMLGLWCTGSTSMLTYVLLTDGRLPLVMTYSCTTIISAGMLILYLRYR